MSRQKRRRRDREAQAPAPVVAVADTPVNWSRLRQVFGCMRGRGVALGFVPCGPVVDAWTPKELAEATEQAIINRVKDDTPS